jgi:CRISPR-associated endonuclease/helicase Cas3
MLNVPTGGGKTNISIRLVLDILKNNQDINKAFWVFPYINIIEQNYEVIRKTLFSSIYDKLLDENISMIHSSKIRQVNSSKEDSILNDFQVYLDDLFLNNPLNIISNINFFEAFIKTKKSNRHKLAYLTNSVVVIDEIQTLKIENLDFFL